MRQGLEAANKFSATTGIRKVTDDRNPMVDFIYEWKGDEAPIIILDHFSDCAWANPRILS